MGTRLTLWLLAPLAAALFAPSAGAAIPPKTGRPFLGPTLPSLRSLRETSRRNSLLVQFARGPQGAKGERAAAAAGAHQVSKTLDIWLLPRSASTRLLPSLVRAGALTGAEPNQELARPSGFAPLAFSDPLVPYEWWRPTIGADAVNPPGPGVPITIVDTGVDLTHPEFQGMSIVPLNTQVLTDSADDYHGTAVASIAAAPANGVGMVGVYPGANLWSWDVHEFDEADVIQGIDTAIRRGKSVINMSFGGTVNDPLFDDELLVAFGAGSLLVAGAGNDYTNGNPVEYPAGNTHVLTVGATDQQNKPAAFSEANDWVDLTAPGVNIVTAAPLSYSSSGYGIGEGTSFSTPMVSGAAAWVWTARPTLDVTQLFSLMRFSARDIWTPGYDINTGFGMLDIPAALTQPAPPPDPYEPNDDIYMVKRNGLFADGDPPLTSPGNPTSAVLPASLDYTEDPEDVYRFWMPAHEMSTIRAVPDDEIALEIWKASATSVHEKRAARRRDLLGVSNKPGKQPEVITIHNRTSKGTYAYADVFLTGNAGDADYTIKVTNHKTGR